MAQGKFVAYYRVSTTGQGASGLGLDAQRRAVADFLNGGRWKLLGEFTEVESGKRSDRPKLEQAKALAKKHRATLIIAKLDRLSRSVAFIANLMESGVEFVAADNPHANRLTVHILAAVAEDEARRISERTRVALAAAKARGRKLGSPDPSKGSAIGARVNREQADKLAANVLPIIRDAQRTGAGSLREIANALNARGIKSARGGKWGAQAVANVLRRCG
jgi:DNA invertase Pin-like site-specific DNA recombinase